MQVVPKLHAFLWQSTMSNNCNTYVIDGETRVLIDPGHLQLFDHVQKGLANMGLTVDDIGLVICTHAHPDHIEAVQLFKKASTLITAHEEEWHFIKTMDAYIRASYGIGSDDITPDFLLREGDLSLPGLELKVLHTPGHSPGSASIYWPEQKVLFTGDVVFKGGIGRTDVPGGDSALLKESIKGLSALDAVWVLTGHGEIVEGRKSVEANFEHIERFWFPQL
jgi:glyoxylase-like metal-dependent hydrolase (beta-lactamase superfamily II)